MDGLADRVIEANEKEEEEARKAIEEAEIVEKKPDDPAPVQLYTDDLGYWVEQDIRKHKNKFARYILFRCRILNDDLNIRYGNTLCKGHETVFPTPEDIASLADLPENITRATARWVYKRLFAESPHLDMRKIEITPGWIWDLDKQEIIRVGK